MSTRGPWVGSTLVVMTIVLSASLTSALGQGERPSLLITEVYYDTPGIDEDEEWVELSNLGAVPIDLADYKFGDEESTGGEGMMRFPSDARIDPGQVIIVAQTAAGFRSLFGLQPDYELRGTDSTVPDMVGDARLANGTVRLANDGDEILLLDANDTVVDTVVFGDSDATISGNFRQPAVTAVQRGQSIERIPADCDTDSSADWKVQPAPTPGKNILEGDCQFPDGGVRQYPMAIGEIQGRGLEAAFVSRTVTFVGVVTGLFEDQNVAGIRYHTAFLQDPPGREDGDPETSDGIAVFFGRRRPNVAVGDLVRVTGQVTEFFGLTEVDDKGLEVVVESRNKQLPQPVEISPPSDQRASAEYFEPFESMYVTMPNTKVVGPTFASCGFAVVDVSNDQDRFMQRTSDDPLGQIVNVLNISDVTCQSFPKVNFGDRVEGLVGPLTYHFDQYKIVMQSPEVVEVTRAPLPDSFFSYELGDNQYSIATLNLHDYFEPTDEMGAESVAHLSMDAFTVKTSKLVDLIGRTLSCPTLLAVQETESEALLTALADQLEDHCGFTYQVSHRESPDTRGIDVALLSDPTLVNVLGAELRQVCSVVKTDVVDESVKCAQDEQPLFSRPPLEVRTEIDQQPLNIFVNHFKSKRGGESETEPQRLAQASFQMQLVSDLLASDEETRIIVLGDFNDYDRSPVKAILTHQNMLHDVLERLPEIERYSYIFSGASQLVDWILVSPALKKDVVEVGIAHVNADFAYSLGKDAGLSALPFRSSDHDIPILILSRSRREVPVAPAEEGQEVEQRRVTVEPDFAHATIAAMPERPVVSSSTFPVAVWVIVAAAGLLFIALLLVRRH